MNPLTKSRALLAASLATLFVSGVVIGRFTAPSSPAAALPASAKATWAESASRNLAADLQLDSAQRQRIDQLLAPVGESLHDDQENALFTMYLRMLRVHDTISTEIQLSAAQSARLAASRAKLKGLIIERFPQRVSGNLELSMDPSSMD
jgi:hypothetical protein